MSFKRYYLFMTDVCNRLANKFLNFFVTRLLNLIIQIGDNANQIGIPLKTSGTLVYNKLSLSQAQIRPLIQKLFSQKTQTIFSFSTLLRAPIYIVNSQCVVGRYSSMHVVET